ncbi:unnamed protein product [Ambrosiozyma monospora]|uniref:Unnamed protein product n=1 Tax=Ambrosiozyma monospora TaxID=43982 RepID=A0ACB5T3B9_AMBMO|nr:unnamed protein product [Ambrosiozyma monospora]
MSNWKKLFNKGLKSSGSGSAVSSPNPNDDNDHFIDNNISSTPSLTNNNDYSSSTVNDIPTSTTATSATVVGDLASGVNKINIDDQSDANTTGGTFNKATTPSPTKSNYNNNQSSANTTATTTTGAPGVGAGAGVEPEVLMKSLENTDPVMDDSTNPVADAEPVRLKPGLLTVKVYSAKDLHIPVPLRINKQILSKLASLGMNVNENELLTKIENLNESLDEAANTNLSYYLPSTLKINNASEANKNVITTYNLVYAVVEVENSSERINSTGNTIAHTKFNSVTTFDITSPNTANLTVHIYVRIPGSLLESNTQEDHLIGSLNYKLNSGKVQYNTKDVRLLNHDWRSLVNPYTDEQLIGALNITLDFKPLTVSDSKSLGIDDFALLKVIGKGSFGKVMQVKKKDTGKIYALKSIRKAHVVNKMEVTHTLAEKFVLSRVNSPFIVPLKFAFQSNEKLYLVLSFINGGELFYHLQKSRRFPLIRAKFYICELLSAIETLHKMNIVYRDLKPENILLDYQGHIALCDFGLCKINMKLDQKTNTFCGTPEYLAPELLLGKGYTRVVDFWTLERS